MFGDPSASPMSVSRKATNNSGALFRERNTRIFAAPPRTLAEMDVNGQIFDGFGIGGALRRKENLGTIVSRVSSDSPDRPRHLLGISGPAIFSQRRGRRRAPLIA